ncbi:MAG: hypothetical protein QOJ03_1224 [Frankiaceae bacterium]|nr:hypothetical protein [Frankiaceae bacterium]
MSPLRFRALDGANLDDFCAGLDDGQLQDRLAHNIAVGTVRPEWCWTAYDEDGVRLARHYWWGPPDATAPIVFTSLDNHDATAAVELLRHAREQLHVVEAWSEVSLPAGVEGDPWTTKPGEVALLEGAGFRFQVDRVRIEWTAAATPTAPPTRLAFRPAGSVREEDLVELFVSVADGSLDHSMQQDRTIMSEGAEARKRVDFLRRYPGTEDRFVVATDDGGRMVGYVAPAWSNGVGVVAEIGVAQPFRGQGYVHDLLAHATCTLVAAGARRIVADTDCVNTPMRAAFARAGYREFARRWDWGWRHGSET